MTENIAGALILIILMGVIIYFFVKNKKEGKDNYSDLNDGSGNLPGKIMSKEIQGTQAISM